MTRFTVRLAAAVCLCVAASLTAQTKPAKPEKAGPPPALSAAITALGTEFEAALKDPAAVMRTKADYFSTPPAGVDAKTLIDTLGKRLHKDPRADAYIKWQLLSAQTGLFDDDAAKHALALYRRAPKPPMRLGSSNQEQSSLAAQINKLKKDDVPQANAQWNQQLLQQAKSACALQYRDELYARLPRTPELFQAAFSDASDRIQAGYEVTPLLTMLTGDVRGWAATAKPNEVKGMIRLIGDYSGRTGAKAFGDIEFDDKRNAVSFKPLTPTITKKTCDQLMTDLAQMARAG